MQTKKIAHAHMAAREAVNAANALLITEEKVSFLLVSFQKKLKKNTTEGTQKKADGVSICFTVLFKR